MGTDGVGESPEKGELTQLRRCLDNSLNKRIWDKQGIGGFTHLKEGIMW